MGEQKGGFRSQKSWFSCLRYDYRPVLRPRNPPPLHLIGLKLHLQATLSRGYQTDFLQHLQLRVLLRPSISLHLLQSGGSLVRDRPYHQREMGSRMVFHYRVRALQIRLHRALLDPQHLHLVGRGPKQQSATYVAATWMSFSNPMRRLEVIRFHQ